MTRKNAIIIIIITLLIALGVVLYLTFFIGGDNDSGLNNENDESGVNTFFPTTNDSNVSGDGGEGTPQNNFQVSIPSLRQLSNVPISGFVLFEREIETTSLLFEEEVVEDIEEEDTTETVFRFIERSTGNIYETTARDLSTKRITNTTIPKIYESIFTDDG